MAGSNFNTIYNAPEFTHEHQRAYEKMFYGMNSEFANIQDGYLDKDYDRPVVFGNGNNEQLAFAPQGNFEERNLNYKAVDAYARATRKSWGRRFTQPLLSFPSRVASIAIPAASYLGSVAGKPTQIKPVLGKRRRCVCGDCDDCTTGKERWVPLGPVGQPANNVTNPNIHDYVRPPRKLRFGGWFQGKEDNSWTVDPRTGHRIPA
ncbi:hypothetical protein DPSP01_001904 [Paraphaeosphaeria sporulosa]